MIVVERRDRVMSILQYCVSFPDSKMPNPRRALSRAMPLSAIVAANKEVRLLTAKNSKRGSYHKYTPKEHADIGKYGHENDVQAARRKFS